MRVKENTPGSASEDVRVPDEAEHSLLATVDALVGEWLTLPDVADRLGVDISRVRRLLDDRDLVAVRRGRPRVLSVPLAFVEPDLRPALAGTLSVLADSGYGDLEALRWLFSHDEVLEDTPVGQLRKGHKTEIRRRAQALAF